MRLAGVPYPFEVEVFGAIRAMVDRNHARSFHVHVHVHRFASPPPPPGSLERCEPVVKIGRGVAPGAAFPKWPLLGFRPFLLDREKKLSFGTGEGMDRRRVHLGSGFVPWDWKQTRVESVSNPKERDGPLDQPRCSRHGKTNVDATTP